MRRFLFTIIFLAIFTAVGQAKDGFVYDDHGKRDPFWSLVSSAGSITTYDSDYRISDLQLEGIMTGNDGNLVVINGKIFKIKDMVGEYSVEQITASSVILKKGTQIFELQLKKEE